MKQDLVLECLLTVNFGGKFISWERSGIAVFSASAKVLSKDESEYDAKHSNAHIIIRHNSCTYATEKSVVGRGTQRFNEDDMIPELAVAT